MFVKPGQRRKKGNNLKKLDFVGVKFGIVDKDFYILPHLKRGSLVK